MFRTIFTTLRALLKSGLCGTQMCIRSDTASYNSAVIEMIALYNVKSILTQDIIDISSIQHNLDNRLLRFVHICIIKNHHVCSDKESNVIYQM